MRAENLTWISEPSQPYDEKLKQWPRWTYWNFKCQWDGVECDTKFVMGIEEHEVYLAEKEVLNFVDMIKLILESIPNQNPSEMKSELIRLIETYGNRREEKGRSDVHEDWAESGAGESI